MRLLARLAVRNLSRHKARTAATLLTVALGVAGLVLSGGFVRDIYTQLGEALIHSQSGHLQVARNEYFLRGARQPDQFLIEDAPARVKEIEAMSGVRQAFARVQFAALASDSRADLPVIVEGIEPARESRLGTFLKLTAGRALADDDTGGILVGEGIASALKLVPGQPVSLTTNVPGGGLNSQEYRVIGVFQSFSREFDARAVRIALPAAQELLNVRGANTVVVELASTGETATMAARLRELFARRGYEVKTWTELNDFFPKTVELYGYQFGALRVVILLMLVLSVANTLNMTLFERTAEFGTMRALGNPGAYIRALITVEGALLGAAGASLGIGLGILAALLVNQWGIDMPPPPNANAGYKAFIRLSAGDVVLAGVIGVGACMLATVLPARRVTRMPIIDALRAGPT